MIFINSVRTAKKTPHFTFTKINWLMLFKEIIVVYFENHTKLINTLRGKVQCYWMLKQVVHTWVTATFRYWCLQSWTRALALVCVSCTYGAFARPSTLVVPKHTYIHTYILVRVTPRTELVFETVRKPTVTIILSQPDFVARRAWNTCLPVCMWKMYDFFERLST
jgi:hypothetical protein